MREYIASRFSVGNFLFPSKLSVSEHEITFIDRKIIGSDLISISFYQIEVVEIRTGLFFATIIVGSEGGAKIIASGFKKADAREIKTLLDAGRGKARAKTNHQHNPQ